MKLTGNRCECRACGDGFNSPSAFTSHRIGGFEQKDGRRCLSHAERLARGWSINKNGFWIKSHSRWWKEPDMTAAEGVA